MEEKLEKLKEKHGPGFQFYAQGGGKWHVQLDTTILSTTVLEGAKADLIKLNFDFYREEGGAQSWFK